MDFDLDVDQSNLLRQVDDAVTALGGAKRAFDLSRTAGYDSALDERLLTGAVGSGRPLLDRVLVAERLAEVGTATTYGLGLVVLDDVRAPEGAFAVADAHRRGPVRYGAQARSVLLLDADEARTVALTEALPAVRSGFGYPYGELDRGALSGDSYPEPAGLRDRWRLGLAAEIAGNAAAAVSGLADHLQGRSQFGTPLATFQALRHRIADAAVSAQATRWMVRHAAFTGERHDIDIAVAYAAATAAALVPDLVQMGGARSFALEFGLHVFTMRLDGLRLELGGADRLAEDALRSGPQRRAAH
jgi:hypothetical protein